MTNCVLGWNLTGTKWNIGQVSNEGSRSGKEGGPIEKVGRGVEWDLPASTIILFDSS